MTISSSAQHATFCNHNLIIRKNRMVSTDYHNSYEMIMRRQYDFFFIARVYFRCAKSLLERWHHKNSPSKKELWLLCCCIFRWLLYNAIYDTITVRSALIFVNFLRLILVCYLKNELFLKFLRNHWVLKCVIFIFGSAWTLDVPKWRGV